MIIIILRKKREQTYTTLEVLRLRVRFLFAFFSESLICFLTGVPQPSLTVRPEPSPTAAPGDPTPDTFPTPILGSTTLVKASLWAERILSLADGDL